MNNPEYIIIHHSATADGNTNDWETIRKNHKELGYRDIGYHYGIENVGGSIVVQKGRLEHEQGAHAKDWNSKSIGICLVGNFQSYKPTAKQMFALKNLCKEVMGRYRIPPERVLGHGEVNNTACPGALFDMEQLRTDLTSDFLGHWAQPSIQKAINAEIMTGFEDGTWRPDQPLTRAEMAIILDRLGVI